MFAYILDIDILKFIQQKLKFLFFIKYDDLILMPYRNKIPTKPLKSDLHNLKSLNPYSTYGI